MFNRLTKAICMLSSCSVVGFKSQLDSYLRNIVDLPCHLDTIIVWAVGIDYMMVTTRMTWRQLDAAKQTKVSNKLYVIVSSKRG